MRTMPAEARGVQGILGIFNVPIAHKSERNSCEMRCNQGPSTRTTLHLAIHQANSAGCGDKARSLRVGSERNREGPGAETAWHDRCFNALTEVLNMKKYLLLPLVALGLVAWAPNQAKAGVHVSVGFGPPVYYGPYYGPYYPSYYYGPYGHRWHHYRYHHWHHRHRW